MKTRTVTLLTTISCVSWMAVGSNAQSEPTEIRDFAVELAANGVPSGLLVPDEVLIAAKPRGLGRPTGAERATFRSGLAERISAFNSKHNKFRATDKGGIVHVSTVDAPPDVVSALERQTQSRGAVDQPALFVFSMLILPAMTGQEPGGVAGGGDLRNPDCPVLQPVRIAAGTTTPIDMLDQIARQVRGITWLVTYRGDAPNRTLNIGLMCGDGSNMTFAVR